MKIAVTTPTNHIPGLHALLLTKGELFYLENSTKQEIRECILNNNIDAIFCNPNQQSYIIDSELLQGTNISIINTCSTGVNHIDTDYCKNNHIKIWSLTKDFELLNSLPSTAELAFGLMLDLMRNITVSNNATLSKRVWNYLPYIGNQIKDCNIGIVGYGRLGKMMARYCKAFEANVYIYDPLYPNVSVNSLDMLCELCDVVSLHVHVTESTKYMINDQMLSKNIKYLINTSRGEIVDENSVINSLRNGKLRGYAADVVEDEFGTLHNSPFFLECNKHLNFILTPHIGGMTKEGQEKAYKWAANKF